MTNLPARLRTKAGVIESGQKIPWGSDTSLMVEAADLIESQRSIINRMGVILHLSGYEPKQNSDNPLEALFYDIGEILKGDNNE